MGRVLSHELHKQVPADEVSLKNVPAVTGLGPADFLFHKALK